MSTSVFRRVAPAVAFLAAVSPSLTAQTSKGEGPAPPSASQKRESLFKKYFPNPTGRNGMEEYLTAADMVAAARYVDLGLWESYRYSILRGSELDAETWEWISRSKFGDPRKATVLAARRKALEGLSGVRELVRRGNGKPVASLHPTMDMNTLFPELSALRYVIRLLVTEAYVAFADGNSASGTDALLVSLEMANHVPQEAPISRLVTIASNAIVLAEFEKHLDRLSARDVVRVLAVLQQLETWQSGYITAVTGELTALAPTFNLLRKNPKDLDDYWSFPEGSESLFDSLKPSDWQTLLNEAEDKAAERIRSGLDILKGPEDRWFSEFKTQKLGHDENEAAPKSVSDAANMLAAFFTGLMPQMAESEARYRTQLRLLRLHMRILAYKWAEGRLPDRLDQAASPGEIADTFGGGEFQFVPNTVGQYQLFSRGFRNFGRIDLRWRRDPNTPRIGSPDDPPLLPFEWGNSKIE